MKNTLAGSTAERRKLSELEIEDSDETSEEGLSESDDVKVEDGSVFLVGDFVWGKIKNHPWWPGQIYDESTASELALKHKPKDKDSYLVAYFGDGTFSWCPSFQLKSFNENFQSLSCQISSLSFRFAVDDALSILGNLVAQELSCAFVDKDRQVAENAGIRKGVFVPLVRVDRLADAHFESGDVITRVKNAARLVPVENKLELVMLSSKLLAFYRWKGYIELPRYFFPEYIEGLEDVSKRRVDIVSVSAQDGFVSNQDKRYKRRKQNSVTDTMKEKMDTVVKIAGDGKKTHPRRRKLVGQTDLSSSDKGKATGKKRAAGAGADKSRNLPNCQTDTRVGERLSKSAKLIIESPPIRKQCNIVFEKEPTEDCNIKNEEQLLTTDQGHEDIDPSPEEMVSRLKPASFIPLHERPFGSKLDVFSLNKLSHDNDDDEGERPLSAIIFMTFSPGVPLPSKTDLLTEYYEFGSLNEEQTDVVPSSLSAQICFIKKSEGERALVNKNSTDSGTQYRIRYIPKTSSRSSKLNVDDNTVRPLSIKYLKEKLETLISKLSNTDGETISHDLRNELRCEMSSLLAKLT